MKKKKIKKVIIIIVSILILIVELFPIMIIVLNGFKRDIDIWSGNPFSFKPTLQSYKKIFQRSDVWLGLRNSFFVSLISTIISLIVGAMASYAIARFDFKYRETVAIITIDQNSQNKILPPTMLDSAKSISC